MAASGYTPISLYYSTTAAAVPTAGNLVAGELAININDGKLYFKDSSNVVTLLASASGASGGVVGPASATDNAIARFDGTTGKLIQNSAVTIDDTTGSLTFTGSAARILGDFSNATVANRVAFQTSTTNGNLNAGFLPNGTATQAIVRVYNNSDPTNAAGLDINANSTTASLNSIITGTGTYLPLTIFTGGSERLRIDTSGLVYINGTSGTALLTVTTSTTYPALKVPNIVETANIVAGAPSPTQIFYLSSGAVQYYTGNAANSWAVNFAMSAGTALNTAMAVGDSVSVTMLITNSSTAYYNSSVQIDGTTSGVTTKWQGGSAPTSGNVNSIDSYTYVIIKTASATYTVLASQTKFA